MIWTGANDGPFHVTRDNGKTWTNVTPKDLPDRRPRAVDRRVAAPPRLGLLRGLSLPARRLRAVHLSHRRLRQDLDAADRRQERHPGRLADARRARGSRSRRACSTPAPSSACSSRSTTARTGSRSSSTCRTCRSPTSRSTSKDLVIATQGRAFWILDNLTRAAPDRRRRSTTPRGAPLQAARRLPDARRRRVLGPMIDYYLPAAASGAGDDRDPRRGGAVVNCYNSDSAGRRGGGRGGRGGRRRRQAAPSTGAGQARDRRR